MAQHRRQRVAAAIQEAQEKLLAGNPEPGAHTFQRGDVYVTFHVHDALPEPVPAIFGWFGGVLSGGQHDEVWTHTDEKLAKYKVPLIVALDFFDLIDAFETVEEVLLGTTATKIPSTCRDAGERGSPAPTQ